MSFSALQPDLNIPSTRTRPLQKVRTGCRTCKQRKVKCDEAKPACQRCVEYGVECGGYMNFRTWTYDTPLASKPTISQALVAASSPKAKSSLSRSPMPIFGNGEEDRALSAYLSVVGPAISEFSSPGFWKVLIPRSSWFHPSIKHALVALTLRHVHLKVVTAGLNEPDHRSVWHYNQSISLLTREKPTVEVVLLTCFVFFTFESHEANFTASRQHLISGLNIIRDWQSQRRPDYPSGDMTNQIIPRFYEGLTYLEACSSGLRFSPTASLQNPKSRCTPTATGPKVIPEPPSTVGGPNGTFVSLDAACDALEDCIRKAPLRYKNRSSTLTPFLLRWKRTFDASRIMRNSRRSLIRMLEVHYLTCRMVGASLHTDTEDTDNAFNAYEDTFEYLNNEMEVLVDDLQVRSEFSQSLGLIPPLFLTALKSKRTRTKRRAIDLLYSLRSREGHWTSCTAAKIADACLNWQMGEPKAASDEDTSLSSQRRLGSIQVEISTDSLGRQTAWLTSGEMAEPMDLGFNTAEIVAVQWPISEVLDAYGYQVAS